MKLVLLLLITVPVIELWLLIDVGTRIGALPTIAMVLLTALIGVALLRNQSADTLLRARQKLARNQAPLREVVDGLFFAVGGVMLLTPGFITDILGFLCLTPGIRMLIIGFLLKRLLVKMSVNLDRYNSNTRQESQRSPRTLEGELDEEKF